MTFKMVMARFNRSRHPIDSRKHIIDTQGIVTASTSEAITIAQGLDSADISVNANQCESGSTVTSFFLSVFYLIEGNITASNVPVINWYIIYDRAGRLHNNGSPTFGVGTRDLPIAGATGLSPNRNQILHEEKGLTTSVSDGSTPMVFKGVIKIPRGKQRMGVGDKILLVHSAGTEPMNFCFKAIYKDYR